MENNKLDFRLAPDFPMYDMCYCMAKCDTPCARKKTPVGICTVSDYSSICSCYKAKEDKR